MIAIVAPPILYAACNDLICNSTAFLVSPAAVSRLVNLAASDFSKGFRLLQNQVISVGYQIS